MISQGRGRSALPGPLPGQRVGQVAAVAGQAAGAVGVPPAVGEQLGDDEFQLGRPLSGQSQRAGLSAEHQRPTRSCATAVTVSTTTPSGSGSGWL
ncbi:hypothetical protein M8C13_32640 [Crossiella sp. SN42]|uniref:hypothetical protein n=1 Tax=Crossiella sp. SN42 TaxID=2944808 RepID=UPI00207CF02D|nr:hypothetical protein [Crossiella sp. SN42]MCO1580513.1 hypothetical protein [Crossiella sp. SN42]